MTVIIIFQTKFTSKNYISFRGWLQIQVSNHSRPSCGCCISILLWLTPSGGAGGGWTASGDVVFVALLIISYQNEMNVLTFATQRGNYRNCVHVGTRGNV